MWRKIFTGVVVVGLLGFGARSAQADEVRFAVPSAFSVSTLADPVIITGVPNPGPAFPDRVHGHGRV